MISAPQPEVGAVPPFADSNGNVIKEGRFPESPGDSLKTATPCRFRAPVIAAFAIVLFSLTGIALALWLRTVFAGYPDPRSWFNVFFVLFARHEVAGLSIVALFYVAIALFFLRAGRWGSVEASVSDANAVTGQHNRNASDTPAATTSIWHIESSSLFRASVFGFRAYPILLALVVFAIAAIGTQVVMHDYLLTGDEYAADFQAKIFARGMVQARVPDAYTQAVNVIKPMYIAYYPSTHTWNSAYLPVYAAMRALFSLVFLQSVLNPFLAAVTIIALYGVARSTWPDSKTNALIAVGLLASSSQFLLMSMTGYSMPAHLALNTIWLWLYSQPDKPRFYLAPFVGVLAVALHQPTVHALFAFPFLVRLLLMRRWKATIFFAAVYLIGCAGWFYWWILFRPGTNGGEVASVFRLFSVRAPIIQSMNLWLVIGWSSLATPLLILLGLRRVFTTRDQSAPTVPGRRFSIGHWALDVGRWTFSLNRNCLLQDAAFSCTLTFAFYYFFYLDQAHGWGYRYVYGALGCLTLVAVAGFERLSILIGQRRALALTTSGIALSMFIQLPLRCFQAESFVRPYAQALEAFRNMRADIVAFDPRDAWYSADLTRNDPFLEQRPIIVRLMGLTPETISALQRQPKAYVVPAREMARFGLSTTRPNHYGHDPFMLGAGK
jgi:hypothetical protein